MRGLELAREYYERYGRPMLERDFPDVIERIAVGLVGEGSECLGYDDELSRDHDFEPGFCLWLTEADERAFGFRLERAYAALPAEFEGLSRARLAPVGGARRGVMTVGGFYERFLGAPDVPGDLRWWLYVPSHSLLVASSGEVFADPLGEFSAVREKLISGYPEDISRKKLAAHLVLMAQTGQYNYVRCAKRGDRGAAALAMAEFVRHTISVIYLLNGKYEPFYKWAFRGLEGLSVLGDIGQVLNELLEVGNGEREVRLKQEVVEDIALLTVDALSSFGVKRTDNDLEKAAYMLLDGVRDPMLRNMHIMEGI